MFLQCQKQGCSHGYFQVSLSVALEEHKVGAGQFFKPSRQFLQINSGKKHLLSCQKENFLNDALQ